MGNRHSTTSTATVTALSSSSAAEASNKSTAAAATDNKKKNSNKKKDDRKRKTADQSKKAEDTAAAVWSKVKETPADKTGKENDEHGSTSAAVAESKTADTTTEPEMKKKRKGIINMCWLLYGCHLKYFFAVISLDLFNSLSTSSHFASFKLFNTIVDDSEC